MAATPTKKEFFILIEKDFGSRSPAMHNAAFEALGLPHRYGVLELPKAGLEDLASPASAALRARFRDEAFGGASVTIPHKQTVTPFLDDLTDAAERIGAVNTVIPSKDGTLLGDNTDWLGVCEAIDGALERKETSKDDDQDDDHVSQGSSSSSSGKKKKKKKKALVVGTGGTARAAAYALTEGARKRGGDGYELYVHARDLDKARALAEAFGGEALGVPSGSFAAIVSTIPGDAKFKLPICAFAGLPAVLDAAYKPAETALLAQARHAGCPVAQGATMLWHQGVAQFELWTGRDAPRDVMRAAVFDGVPDLEQN